MNPNLPKKNISSRKQKKWTPTLSFAYLNQSRYQILAKLTFWIFRKNLPQKGIFGRKQKMNITIEFCMLELEKVPNFSINRQFWIFGPNLLKKGFSGWKQKNRIFVCVLVVAYYIRLLRTVAHRRNGILLFLLLLVAETIMFNVSAQ